MRKQSSHEFFEDRYSPLPGVQRHPALSQMGRDEGFGEVQGFDSSGRNLLLLRACSLSHGCSHQVSRSLDQSWTAAHMAGKLETAAPEAAAIRRGHLLLQ